MEEAPPGSVRQCPAAAGPCLRAVASTLTSAPSCSPGGGQPLGLPGEEAARSLPVTRGRGDITALFLGFANSRSPPGSRLPGNSLLSWQPPC